MSLARYPRRLLVLRLRLEDARRRRSSSARLETLSTPERQCAARAAPERLSQIRGSSRSSSGVDVRSIAPAADRSGATMSTSARFSYRAASRRRRRDALRLAGDAAFAVGGLLLGALAPLSPTRMSGFKRNAAAAAFEEQFPEAIDLIARALRAGHAFTTGIGMVADEIPAPVGAEFRRLYDEQNFGMSLPDALRAMASACRCSTRASSSPRC